MQRVQELTSRLIKTLEVLTFKKFWQLPTVLYVFVFFGFFSMYSTYPFYTTWDMDFITTLDTLHIDSHILPRHIHHPSFGMYLIFQATQFFAEVSGFLPKLDFDALQDSLTPLAAVAQRTDFIRWHSPFIAFGIMFFLINGIRYLSKEYSFYFLVTVFAVLVSQQGLWFHSTYNRTEFFALFYWSLSLYFAFRSTRNVEQSSWKANLFLVGLFSGLSFLTKLQSIVLILSVPVFLLMANSSLEKAVFQISSKALGKRAAILSGIALLFFLVMAFCSYHSPLGPGFGHFASTLGEPNFFFRFFFTVIGALFGLSLWVYVTSKAVNRHDETRTGFLLSKLFFLTIIILGFLSAFLTHFFIFSSPSLSFEYLLADFKMLFLRKSYAIPGGSGKLFTGDFADYWIKLKSYGMYINFAAFVGVLGLLNWFLNRTKVQLMHLAFYVVIFLMFIFNTTFGVRLKMLDLIWVQLSFNTLSLVGLVFFWPKNRALGLMVSAVIVFIVSLQSSKTLDQIQTPNRSYYKLDEFFGSVYALDHTPYKGIVSAHYGHESKTPERSKAMVFLRKSLDGLKISNYISEFGGNNPRFVGPVGTGSRWSHVFKEEGFFEKVGLLDGAIVYDYFGEFLEGGHGKIILRTRQDLEIYLYSSEKKSQAYSHPHCEVTRLEPELRVSRNGKSIAVYPKAFIGTNCQITVDPERTGEVTFLIFRHKI